LSKSNLLSVEDLSVEFITDRTRLHAVDGVSLSLDSNQTLGIVGESGCGKSVTALAIMGLLPHNTSITGRVIYKEQNLLTKRNSEMAKIRGNKISMIFQEPMTSLNPVFTIENQLAEVLQMHQPGSKKEIRQRIVELLRLVGIPNPERRMKDYPHRFSGGMRQRVMIAMALACEPDILIADEPTTALDVTIQAQILVLMKKLQQEFSTGLIVITHDLGVVAQVADNVAVMYAGQVMEYTSVKKIFAEPKHPYTKGLIRTIPSIIETRNRLEEIKGMVPHMSNVPLGCRFHERCDMAFNRCREETPTVLDIGEEHLVRCWLYA
jgi:oligopeptide/dipeptide ABC transporter ATP-binding protein